MAQKVFTTSFILFMFDNLQILRIKNSHSQLFSIKHAYKELVGAATTQVPYICDHLSLHISRAPWYLQVIQTFCEKEQSACFCLFSSLLFQGGQPALAHCLSQDQPHAWECPERCGWKGAMTGSPPTLGTSVLSVSRNPKIKDSFCWSSGFLCCQIAFKKRPAAGGSNTFKYLSATTHPGLINQICDEAAKPWRTEARVRPGRNTESSSWEE